MPDEKEPEVVETPPEAPQSVQIVEPISAPAEISHAPKELSVESLISQAIVNNTPVDTLERLLAMRRELKAEAAKELFDADMAGFQGDCPVINKTKDVKTKSGQTAYKYAPLDVIVGQVKDLLNQHGFSYAIQTETLESKVKVTCITKHKAGHSENNSVEVPLGTKTEIMSNTQVVAAALTFAKRYAFCNAFGILTGDDDDDAVSTKGVEQGARRPQNSQSGSYNRPATNPTAPPQKAVPQTATDEQKRRIFALGKDLNQTPEGTKDFIKNHFKLEHFNDLLFKDAAAMIRALDKKKQAKQDEQPDAPAEDLEAEARKVFDVEDEGGEVVTGQE